MVLHTNATTNNPAESVAWGEAAPGADGGRPLLLRAQREVRLYGQVRDTALFLPEPENRTVLALACVLMAFSRHILLLLVTIYLLRLFGQG